MHISTVRRMTVSLVLYTFTFILLISLLSSMLRVRVVATIVAADVDSIKADTVADLDLLSRHPNSILQSHNSLDSQDNFNSLQTETELSLANSLQQNRQVAVVDEAAKIERLQARNDLHQTPHSLSSSSLPSTDHKHTQQSIPPFYEPTPHQLFNLRQYKRNIQQLIDNGRTDIATSDKSKLTLSTSHTDQNDDASLSQSHFYSISARVAFGLALSFIILLTCGYCMHAHTQRQLYAAKENVLRKQLQFSRFNSNSYDHDKAMLISRVQSVTDNDQYRPRLDTFTRSLYNVGAAQDQSSSIHIPSQHITQHISRNDNIV